MKQHSQEHGCTTPALTAYPAQLSSLLSELQKISEVVDSKWVSILTQRTTNSQRHPLSADASGHGKQQRPKVGDPAAEEHSPENADFFENIYAAEDSQQTITWMPGDKVLACNIAAGARSIQHIGPRLPARSA